MEPSPTFTVQTPVPPVLPPPHTNTVLRRVIAIVLILAVLVIVAGGLYVLKNRGFMSVLPKGASVELALGVVPIGTAFSLTTDGTLTPVTSTMQGMQVIDQVDAGSTTYYLLGDPSTFTSNLYKEVDGTLTQVTDSATLKFDLTFDPASGTFAYLAGTVASTTMESFVTAPWELSLFSPESGERTLPGSGHDPVLLSGAGHLLVGNQGTIELVDTVTGARSLFLTLPSDAPFAISADGMTLALYNAPTGAVDYFSLSGTAASYQHSKKVTRMPSALAFAGKTLIMATNSDDRATVQLSIVGGPSLDVPNPVAPSVPQKLIITYE